MTAQPMTARDELRKGLWSGLPRAKCDALLDAYRAQVLREAAAEVWANRAISYELEIEGWEGAHALLIRMAEVPTPAPPDPGSGG